MQRIFTLQTLRCVRVHSKRHVRTSPSGWERRNPPDENSRQSFAERGIVINPVNIRKTDHHKHMDVSETPIVAKPIVPAIKKGTNRKTNRKGEDSTSEEEFLLMKELLRQNPC